MSKWLMVVSIGAGALTASCSSRDAASETPVTPLDGQYSLVTEVAGTLGGTVPVKSGGSDRRSESVCIAGGHGDGLITTVVSRSGMLHPGCQHSPAPRVGNAISGRHICPTDPQRAPGGRFLLDYTGTVAAEEVTAAMTLTLDLPEATLAALPAEQRDALNEAGDMLDDVVIEVRATRTGDCPT